MTDEQQQPKIIIDEDWKTQAQAEKEALEKQREPGTKEQSAAKQPAAKQSSANEPSAAESQAQQPLPPASLLTLLTMLATQASLALGAGANPLTGKVEVDLAAARHLIDLLQVLEEKTRGNLTPQESALLAGLLDDLRMAFVSVQTQQQSAGTQPPAAG